MKGLRAMWRTLRRVLGSGALREEILVEFLPLSNRYCASARGFQRSEVVGFGETMSEAVEAYREMVPESRAFRVRRPWD